MLKYQKSTEQNPALHCKTKTLLVSSDIRVGKSRRGWCGASPVVSDVRAHLDKSFVSAEGWNVRLCCGFEVQINVRREVSAWCCEGRMMVMGWGGLKDWGTWNINDVDFLPQLSPGRPRCLRPVRNSEDGADGGRGV